MASFKSLLVASDFSVDGNNAVRRAALLAHEHGAQLHILHVLKATGCKPLREWFSPTIDIDLKAAQARKALRQVAVEISCAYGVTPRTEVLVGDAFEVLMQASACADLVVLGGRGRGRLNGLRVGNTVDRLLRTCRRPVLVVKTPVAQSYRKILVPIDFTTSADAAIRVAARMRRASGLYIFHALSAQRVAVLRDAHVPEHIISKTRMLEEAGTDARMRRKVAGLGLDTARMHFALTYGPAVPSTLCQAQNLGVDLIVAGKQGRSSVSGFLLGSVSSQVLSGSGCDMLIVPRPRDEAPLHAAPMRDHRVPSSAQPGNAPLMRDAAAHAGALPPAHWVHNTARFMQRRTS